MSPTADTASVDLLLPIMDMPLFFFFSSYTLFFYSILFSCDSCFFSFFSFSLLF